MLRVGIFEAKAQLSQLVERVAQGEEVLVTCHGKPVARLVAPVASSPTPRRLPTGQPSCGHIVAVLIVAPSQVKAPAARCPS